MPTIVVASSIQYVNPSAPVGFEVRLHVHDPAAGGGAGKTFVSCISVDPGNATYWTLDAGNSTGKWNEAAVPPHYVRDAADVYDPEGITATWTERISDNSADRTIYVLRGRFRTQSGLIQVTTQSVQMDDGTNSSTEYVTIPIPSPQGW